MTIMTMIILMSDDDDETCDGNASVYYDNHIYIDDK